MMDMATVRYYARKAGSAAKRDGLKPFQPESLEDLTPGNPKFKIPNLGTYVPAGWQRTEDVWFVDKTGCGREDEPALTVPRFVEKLQEYFATHPTAGYGVIYEGEFQVYVAAFEKLPQAVHATAEEDAHEPVEFAFRV
jgi:hypothetical protein